MSGYELVMQQKIDGLEQDLASTRAEVERLRAAHEEACKMIENFGEAMAREVARRNAAEQILLAVTEMECDGAIKQPPDGSTGTCFDVTWLTADKYCPVCKAKAFMRYWTAKPEGAGETK